MYIPELLLRFLKLKMWVIEVAILPLCPLFFKKLLKRIKLANKWQVSNVTYLSKSMIRH